MQILAFGVVDLTEQSTAAHFANLLAEGHVAVVFRVHVGLAALFHGLLQPPQLIHGDAGGHFAQDVLAGLQRGDGLRNVALHRRGDDHRVDVRFEHVVEDPVGVGNVVLLALGGQELLVQIAQRGDLDALDGLEAHQRGKAPSSGNADFQRASHNHSPFLNGRSGAPCYLGFIRPLQLPVL